MSAQHFMCAYDNGFKDFYRSFTSFTVTFGLCLLAIKQCKSLMNVINSKQKINGEKANENEQQKTGTTTSKLEQNSDDNDNPNIDDDDDIPTAVFCRALTNKMDSQWLFWAKKHIK